MTGLLFRISLLVSLVSRQLLTFISIIPFYLWSADVYFTYFLPGILRIVTHLTYWDCCPFRSQLLCKIPCLLVRNFITTLKLTSSRLHNLLNFILKIVFSEIFVTIGSPFFNDLSLNFSGFFFQ